jgi:hypothetical protein
LLDVFGAARMVAASFAPVAVPGALFAGTAPPPLRRVLDDVLRFATVARRKPTLEDVFTCDEPPGAEWERGAAEDDRVMFAVLRAMSKGAEKRAIARVLSAATSRLERQGLRPAIHELVAEANEELTGGAAPVNTTKPLGEGDVWARATDEETLRIVASQRALVTE